MNAGTRGAGAFPGRKAAEPGRGGGGRKLPWAIAPVAFLVLHLVGSAHPSGPVWGFHVLAYFGAFVRWGVAAVVLLLVVLYLRGGALARVREAVAAVAARGNAWGWLSLAAAGAAFVLFRIFAVEARAYGDTRSMAEWYGDNETFQLSWVTDVVSPHLIAKKEAIAVALHRILSHLSGMPIESAYRLLSSIVGALVILALLLLVRRATRPAPGTEAGLAACVLLAGGNQVFFGHVENYAVAQAAAAGYLGAAWLGFERKGALPWAALALLVAVRTHGSFFTFVPSFLVLAAFHYREREWSRLFLRGRTVAWTVLAPVVAGGLLLYVFVFRSAVWPQTITGPLFQCALLPVTPTPPPFGSYSLFSPSHLIDLANAALLNFSPALLLLLAGAIRRPATGIPPRTLFYGLNALLLGGFYFMVNPALSMPRDWDLFTLPAVPIFFLLLAVTVEGGVRPAAENGKLLLVLTAGVFPILGFAVNASPERASRRIEDLGEYVFRTYHVGAGYIIQAAQLMEEDPGRRLERRRAVIERLEATPPDAEMAFLLNTAGRMAAATGDVETTVDYWERELAFSSDPDRVRLDLARLQLERKDPQAARRQVDAVLARDPEHREALRASAVVSVALADSARFAEAVAGLRRGGDPDADRLAAWADSVAVWRR